jgi:hypothetical protein
MLAIALALLLAAPAPRTPPKRGPLLAVLELRNKLLPGEGVDSAYLSDVVRTAALRAVPGLRVLTRENVAVLLASAGKKLEECEGECEVQTGRLLGADYIATGEVLRFGTSFKLNLRLHDTREGTLLSGAQASGATLDALDASVTKATEVLLAPMVERASGRGGDESVADGVEGGVAGGVVGGVVSAPPPRPPPPVAKREEPKPAVAKAPVASPPREEPKPAVAIAPVAPPPREEPKPAVIAPLAPAPVAAVESAPEPTRSASALGVFLGGAVDVSGRTAGPQLALVYGSSSSFTVAAGTVLSPHPAARLWSSFALVTSDSGGASLGLEPRLVFAPSFPGGAVAGGGLGLRGAFRLAGWVELVASAGAEAYHSPTGTVFAPVLSLGLLPHL